jgi:ABC-2 type transport system permease protein
VNSVVGAIANVTLRALLSRRRSLLMLLLALSPLLLALLIRAAGRPVDPVRVERNLLDGLVIRTVLPLVALVLGTGAMGSELEDGTGVYLLTKPVPRWVIMAAKFLAAAGLTAALVAPAALLTGLLVAGDQGGGAGIAFAYAIATAIGALLYTGIFLALSIATGRALIIGLVYTLLWEGLLAGLFAGSRAFSVREYTIGIAGLLDPGHVTAQLDPVTAVVGSVAVFGLSFFLATQLLANYQVRGAD